MLITSRTILDHMVEVHVDTDGLFYVQEPGEHTRVATGESMKQAMRAARMEFRKEQIRVAVPFTMMAEGKLQSAIARGFHAKDRNKLLIWVDDGSKDGRNDQIHMWGRQHNVLVSDIPDKDMAWIKKLLARKLKLNELVGQCDRLIREWEEAHTFDLLTATREAVTEAAQAEPDENPDPPVSTDEDAEVDDLLGLED